MQRLLSHNRLGKSPAQLVYDRSSSAGCSAFPTTSPDEHVVIVLVGPVSEAANPLETPLRRHPVRGRSWCGDRLVAAVLGVIVGALIGRLIKVQ